MAGRGESTWCRVTRHLGNFFGGSGLGIVQQGLQQSDGPMQRLLSLIVRIIPDFSRFNVEAPLAASQAISLHTLYDAWLYYGMFFLGHGDLRMVDLAEGRAVNGGVAWSSSTLRWAVVGACCLLLAALTSAMAWQQRPAAAQAELLGVESTSLTEVYAELEPGEFAGTLMLGGMRGLVADLFWLRAIEAKEEGRYYESVALFQLLSRLQPQFEQVWEFLSHDLAYNIPRNMPTQDEKYAWFVAGIEANARGCGRNPRSSRLMRHLAWMLFHRGLSLLNRCKKILLTDFFSRYWLGMGSTPFSNLRCPRCHVLATRSICQLGLSAPRFATAAIVCEAPISIA